MQAYRKLTEIMEKAGVNKSHLNEILDIVNLLEECGVVEARESTM
jgi:hypothetical protein